MRADVLSLNLIIMHGEGEIRATSAVTKIEKSLQIYPEGCESGKRKVYVQLFLYFLNTKILHKNLLYLSGLSSEIQLYYIVDF